MMASMGKGGGQSERERAARNAVNSMSSQMAAITAALNQASLATFLSIWFFLPTVSICQKKIQFLIDFVTARKAPSTAICY